MSAVKIEMLPAQEGDCFLVSIGEKDKINMLIDGGYKETYYEHLKPRLVEMAQKGEKLDLVIVTHIDSDHIEGIIELFKENGNSKKPSIIPIKEVWHNSYRHLQFKVDEKAKLDFREKAILSEKIAKGYESRASKNESVNQNKEISAKDGSTLAALLYSGEYNWNTLYDEDAINYDTKDMVKVTGDITFRLLSPDNNRLERLRRFWLKELRKDKYNFKLTDDKIFDDAYEFFMLNLDDFQQSDENTEISSKEEKVDINSLLQRKTSSDTSPVNGSSISFIIEYQTIKMLFLADSHPQLICEKIKRLKDEFSYNTYFDLIKVSHHGSYRNTSVELLSLIDSSCYLFSTNGKKHNHPSLETIARIISREGEERKLFFNYPLPHDYFSDEQLKGEYNYSIESPTENESTVIEL
ncbi:AVAST type 1 anti-phage system MBL fold metallo-hydrolase Avs1a [Bacillus toyonensis]|uniref:Metallo-beta-lactamase domain-containing protein n=2 Tax=Bacillus toyonensis TaxID=155322 RepID=A0AB36T7S4_9BACI|nr:AVAST type 1 anti-phage system MBL fold metallo-hydrolase Avs1a [Bacillus toyonensis]PEC09869.1 hypothetical protein CON55_15965 [Bacillus toyonensis]PEN90175.1 hypothetical protein CN551_07535 [Bacillus toyonensis]